MSPTLWHRFPGRDLQAILRSLNSLRDDDNTLLDESEKQKVENLQQTVEQGFAAKQDGALDSDFLVLLLEFGLVACHSEHANQLRKILQGLRAYALSLKPVQTKAAGG